MPGRGKGIKRRAGGPTAENTKRKKNFNQDPGEIVDILSGHDGAEPSSSDSEVWVFGDSLVRWAGERYGSKSINNADHKVIWDGKSETRSEELKSAIQRGLLKGYKPSVIIIHVGGNNVSSANTCKIISIVSKALKYLFSVFLNSIVVWTDILPRFNWRGTPNTLASAKMMDLKRKRINRKLKQTILQYEMGRALNHQNINRNNPHFYRPDGIHLSDHDNDAYLSKMMIAISTFTRDNSCKSLNMG
ncbi:uncharacterized protein LOC128552982 [Mercenaria mercenaria]|uniref:uncharacterized protein LOC128552982 n=1 Tax=Mercenaria mercenaria TaxID=6596 RepID=UPI00234F2164|nr:uncharacterized protein LOC128552982 [Mercenaria mercenaria]